MKRKQSAWILVAVLVVLSGGLVAQACSGCGCRAKKASDPSCSSGVCGITDAAKLGETCSSKELGHPVNLTTDQMTAEVEKGEAIILDARSGKYFDGELIPGASQLSARATEEEVAAKLPSKDAQIITYCSNTQCPASAMLAEKLIELGYTNVSEYPEGIAGWKAAGGAVNKSL